MDKTKEKQQQAKIEEEKYDHLLNSMQAQTLIKAVEKYGKDEEDRKEKKYLDECGAANFFGIKGNKYITPFSESILPSITNKSLVQLAEDLGMEVERRHIPIAELEEFDEASACGTAAVCSPISEIDDLDTGKKYIFSTNGEAGPMTTKLYNKLRAVQLGDEPDVHGWNCVLD